MRTESFRLDWIFHKGWPMGLALLLSGLFFQGEAFADCSELRRARGEKAFRASLRAELSSSGGSGFGTEL
jgi:hypothetical protein